MTAGLAKSCSYKAKLYKKCKLKSTDKNKENYKKYRNCLNDLLYITKKKITKKNLIADIMTLGRFGKLSGL